MESFYSIIYFKTNPLTDEMVSIGILAGGGEGPFMYISNARLDLLKKVLHPNTYLSVRRHLKFLSDKVGKHRNEAAGILLFDPVFSVDQMDILSKRSKNAITYSPPTTINDWLDAQFFSQLIKSFFGETMVVSNKKRPVFHLKWKAFYYSKKFEEWEKDLPISKILSTSSLGLSIDLVHLKDKKIIKGIDFDLSETTLNRKLYEIELITSALSGFNITIIHTIPKKKSGKMAFDTLKYKHPNLVLKAFSEFKKMK